MAFALLALILASVPVIVIPGVLSTFEPVKTTLAGAVAIFAVAAVAGSRLAGGRLAWPDVGGAVDRVRGLRGVRRVAVATLGAYAVVTVLATLLSVSPDTSWFGTLGRGQGTLFLVAVGALVAIGFDAVSTAAGVGTALRALAIGAVPCAIATVLQRFDLDPISASCNAERVQTTIGNALPGSTYLGVATLVAMEHLRLSWGEWQAARHAIALPAAVVVPAGDADGAGSHETRHRTRRRGLAMAAAGDATGLPATAGIDWVRVAWPLAAALAALFVGTWVARGDHARTWVAIPLALAWGAAVARATTREVAIPPRLAVAGWAGLAVLVSIANGVTLSRGPQAGLLAAIAIWFVGVATLGSGRANRRGAAVALGVAVATVLATGAGWLVPSTGCQAEAAPQAAPAPAAVAAVSVATGAPAVASTPVASVPVAPVPAGPTAFDRTLAVLRERFDFLTGSGGAASFGWRTNVWTHAMRVYLDRPPTVEAKARAMAAALAGAQQGDVAALNAAPGSRAPGGWWYRIMGYGPESQVFTLATSTTPEIRAVQGEITYDRAHNVVLEVLLTTGAAGLVAWAANLGASLVLAWRLRRLGAPGVATAALAPILACNLVSGVSGVDATTITLVNWVVIAIAIALPPPGAAAASPRRVVPALAGRRRATVTLPVADDLPRLAIVTGVALAGCVGAAVAGFGATLPSAWATGAFVGLVITGLAVADRPFRRGRPDLQVLGVVVVAAAVATVAMVPGWSAMAAGHYARLTQEAGLPRERVAEIAKRAVALDPGQATYRVLAGSS